jgi:hypothetical protein
MFSCAKHIAAFLGDRVDIDDIGVVQRSDLIAHKDDKPTKGGLLNTQGWGPE